MIETIIESLNSKLSALDYWEKQYCLTELFKSADGITRPMLYDTSGQLINTNNFDHWNGMLYWRKNGDVASVIDNEKKMSGSCSWIKFSFPLKIVSIIPKKKLSKDDAYSDDRVALAIIKTLTGPDTVLKSELKAAFATVKPEKYITDNSAILSAEYDGINITDIRYNFSYVSVEIEVEVLIDSRCIPDECDSPTY